MKMQIPYINLPAQHQPIKDELLRSVSNVFESGNFILGSQVEAFEKSFSAISGTTYALGVANGTDALVLALKALGVSPGDEVITTPNSFLASASCVSLIGAKPVFVDVRQDFNMDPGLLEKAITKKTKAIIPVHLTGRVADMDAILSIADAHSIPVIEDAAQSVGAIYKGKRAGSFGKIGCFSLHPLKNLSACGDGGVITTNEKEMYDYLKVARNHGLINRDECSFYSLNSRLDELQAAILNVKLEHFEEWTSRRGAISRRYTEALKDVVTVPFDQKFETPVYHTYIIQTPRRDELKSYLAEKGVDTKIHYPIPIHLQKAFSYLGYKKGDFPVTERQAAEILSLPVYPELEDAQIEYICDCVRGHR